MTKKLVAIVGFSLFTTISISIASYAQQVTRVSPRDITLRAVSLGSLYTGMAVGDSGEVLATHTASPFGNWYPMNAGVGTSVTLYAVAYAGDTLHTVLGGSQGTLLYTTNGGAKWNPVALGTTAAIRAIVYHDSSLFAVGDSGLIFRSTNKGQSWSKIATPTTSQLNAIAFGTKNDGIAAGNDTTLLQTHDAGLTWKAMPFPYTFEQFQTTGYIDLDFIGVAMTGPDSVWVAMKHGFSPVPIYHGAVDSTDLSVGVTFAGGEPLTYTSILNVGMPGYCKFFSFTLNDILYALISGGISETAYFHQAGDADGGVDGFPFRILASAIWKQDTNILMVMVGESLTINSQFLTDSVAVKTQQLFPSTFTTKIAGNGSYTDFLDVSILPNGYGYAVGTTQDFERTVDSGKHWVSVPIPIGLAGQTGLDSAINNVYTIGKNSAIVIGWNGIIYNYSSSGSHFRGVGVAQHERLKGIAFSSTDTGIIVGDLGTVLRSTDQGMTWSSISNSTTNLLWSVAFANNTIGIAAGDSGNILQTTDAGATWTNINSVITGTNIGVRQVQGFSDGTFLARAIWSNDTDEGADLLRSTDFGQSWSFVNLPDNAADWAGMSFYSSRIGVVAALASGGGDYIGDSESLYYTSDAGATWTHISFPFWAQLPRTIFHWLNDNEVTVYGTYGSIANVTFSASGVQVTQLDQKQNMHVYPNPATGDFRVDYITKSSGPVTIQLFSEDGKDIGTLFSGTEQTGQHEHSLILPTELHGSFYLRISKDGTSATAPISFQ